MKEKIIKYIKFLLPQGFKKSYRKYKRQFIRKFKLSEHDRVPLTLSELKNILREDLGLGEGDTVIVHSSFGNMNPGFSPQEVVDLLKKLVGPSGNILMPFYPTTNAFFWMQQDNEFDVNLSRSCMGILTQVFKESEGVRLSPHPVKAVSAWGKDRDFLIEEHHQSIYPYDKHSPYFKTSLLPNSKTIGMGVEVNSFLHTCEDLFLQDKLEIYSEKLFKGKVNYYSGPLEVSTYLHDPQKVSSIMTPCEYMKQTDCPEYRLVYHKGAPYFSSSNAKALVHTEALFLRGASRTYISRHGKA